MPLPGLPQPKNAGGVFGTKYTKSQLSRLSRERPDLFEAFLLKMCEDAAGVTQVEHAATFEGAAQKYRLEIEPVDRHRAAAFIRDTLDGKPDAARDFASAAAPKVYIFNRAQGVDIAFDAETQALLTRELDLGAPEPVDIDDALPENGEEPE